MNSVLKTFLVVGSLSFPFPLTYASDGSTVAGGGGSTEITAFSVCKKVTNSNTASAYVPTASSGEWSSFYTNPPTNVAITPCCGGAKVGGYCWRRGAINASCTTTCGSFGGTTAGTTSYGNTSSGCQAIGPALGYSSFTGTTGNGVWGCAALGTSGSYFLENGATQGGGGSSVYRFCSCSY